MTITTSSPPSCSSATWAQTLSSTSARSAPSSAATIEDPSLATTVMALSLGVAGRRMLGAMTEFGTVRVAAIQATPVILDAEATVEKAIGLIGEAAADGAQLAVLPETFVPLYPSGDLGQAPPRASTASTSSGSASGRTRSTSRARSPTAWPRPAPSTASTSRSASTSARPSARARLYNALLLIGPEGLLWKHRKLMPTHHERLFHGIGAGDDLDAAETAARARSAG